MNLIKFSKLLKRSISSLSEKALKDIFSFRMSPRPTLYCVAGSMGWNGLLCTLKGKTCRPQPRCGRQIFCPCLKPNYDSLLVNPVLESPSTSFQVVSRVSGFFSNRTDRTDHRPLYDPCLECETRACARFRGKWRVATTYP